jgi:hypothetical protein
VTILVSFLVTHLFLLGTPGESVLGFPTDHMGDEVGTEVDIVTLQSLLR